MRGLVLGVVCVGSFAVATAACASASGADLSSATTLAANVSADAGMPTRDDVVEQLESVGFTSDEANCLADNLDFADSRIQSVDIGAMLDLFEPCGIDESRLAELGG